MIFDSGFWYAFGSIVFVTLLVSCVILGVFIFFMDVQDKKAEKKDDGLVE
jgi:hypothetical protein